MSVTTRVFILSNQNKTLLKRNPSLHCFIRPKLLMLNDPSTIWVFPKIMVPQNGWFISWKTLWTNGWFGGVPIFLDTPIYNHLKKVDFFTLQVCSMESCPRHAVISPHCFGGFIRISKPRLNRGGGGFSPPGGEGENGNIPQIGVEILKKSNNHLEVAMSDKNQDSFPCIASLLVSTSGETWILIPWKSWRNICCPQNSTPAWHVFWVFLVMDLRFFRNRHAVWYAWIIHLTILYLDFSYYTINPQKPVISRGP